MFGDQGENVWGGSYTHFPGFTITCKEQVLGYIGHDDSWKISAHFTSKANILRNHTKKKDPGVYHRTRHK